MLARLEQVQNNLGLPSIEADPIIGEAAPELDEATKANLRALGYIE